MFDYVLTSSGGLAGELVMNWRAKSAATFDCEYGFSCMGYEISGAWGAAIARQSEAGRGAQVFSLVVQLGDRGFFTWTEWADTLGAVIKDLELRN